MGNVGIKRFTLDTWGLPLSLCLCSVCLCLCVCVSVLVFLCLSLTLFIFVSICICPSPYLPLSFSALSLSFSLSLSSLSLSLSLYFCHSLRVNCPINTFILYWVHSSVADNDNIFQSWCCFHKYRTQQNSFQHTWQILDLRQSLNIHSSRYALCYLYYEYTEYCYI